MKKSETLMHNSIDQVFVTLDINMRNDASYS